MPTVRPAPPSRPDRRHNILLAAERLFAQRGYHAVSIRDIADAAGVPLALVGYHFGAKQQLYRAIFEHWSVMIDERLQALQRAMDEPGEDRLQRIVEAFIGPVLRLRASPEGENYALLMTRGLAMQSSEDHDIIREFFDPMAQAFLQAFQDTLSAECPQVTSVQVAWCYQFALGALLHHISDVRVARLSGGACAPADPAATPLLIAFITAGLRGAIAAAGPTRA